MHFCASVLLFIWNLCNSEIGLLSIRIYVNPALTQWICRVQMLSSTPGLTHTKFPCRGNGIFPHPHFQNISPLTGHAHTLYARGQRYDPSRHHPAVYACTQPIRTTHPCVSRALYKPKGCRVFGQASLSPAFRPCSHCCLTQMHVHAYTLAVHGCTRLFIFRICFSRVEAPA